MDMQRFLIGLGLVILAVGIVWPILSRIGLGRLPGDIVYERDGTTFYFPWSPASSSAWSSACCSGCSTDNDRDPGLNEKSRSSQRKIHTTFKASHREPTILRVAKRPDGGPTIIHSASPLCSRL